MTNQEMYRRLSERLSNIESELQNVLVKVAVLEERSKQTRKLLVAVFAVVGLVSGSAAGISELLQ